MRPTHSWLLVFAVATGCQNDSATMPDAAATPQTALATFYDKSSSTLGASNVQDAIDELAARPIAEPPLGPRLQLVVKSFPKVDDSTAQSEVLYCPDKEHDIALGGSCGGGGNMSQISDTILSASAYACRWVHPKGPDDSYEIRVRCLTNAL